MHRNCIRISIWILISSLMVSSASISRQVKNYRTLSTASFQIMYERRIPVDDVRLLGKALESDYAIYRKKFNLSYRQKPKVYVLTSSQRLRNESQSLVYDDAAYSDGRLYVSLPQVKGKSMQGSIPRIVAHSLLGGIPTCPPWLLETYAIHAGGDYKRFGKPVQATASTFADLSEDYARGANGSNARQVYALLATTAKFFVDRYGEEKFESVFVQFKRGVYLETAFETSFGEKIADIERAWAQFVLSQVKG